MPVKPLIRITEGWKHDKNKRFGSVVIGVFETYDQQGKIKVFHFAPNLEDLPVIRRLCEIVEEVDLHNKAVYNLKVEAEEIEPIKGNC